ncbi:flagellar assembly protein FliW [Bacillota bacterium LX-D]|nr:flagellar assembly protein FliW [Bacillota bacterium LX-D]
MKLETSSSGSVEVPQEVTFSLPQGLLGFEEFRDFALLPIPENPYFYWLQSIENSSLTFLLVDPFVFFPKYTVDLGDELLDNLKITKQAEAAVFTIVTIPKEGIEKATTNLIGPVVFNLQAKIGRQIIVDANNYSTKHLLFPQKPLAAASR